MPKKRARSDKKKAAKSAEAFSHLVVCLSGTLSLPRSEFQEFVKSNGGQCKSSVTKAVTHLVSTNEELLAATSKVIKAQSYGIPIVNEVDYFVLASIRLSELIPNAGFYSCHAKIFESD